MGNRAAIVFPDFDQTIYLHWNGGIESVAAFLADAEDVGVRHDDYYLPRLLQIIGNHFGSVNSIGLWSGDHVDPEGMDNGVYSVRFARDAEPKVTRHQYNHEEKKVETSPTYTLPELVEQVKDHPYWQAEYDKITIMDDIREVNDPIFKRS